MKESKPKQASPVKGHSRIKSDFCRADLGKLHLSEFKNQFLKKTAESKRGPASMRSIQGKAGLNPIAAKLEKLKFVGSFKKADVLCELNAIKHSLHLDSITGLLFLRQNLISTSEDCTLKLWQLPISKPNYLSPAQNLFASPNVASINPISIFRRKLKSSCLFSNLSFAFGE